MLRIINVLFALVLVLSFSSCKILNPSIMLKTKKDYQFDQIPDSNNAEYRLSPNDIISLRMFTNSGFRLVDMSAMQQGGAMAFQTFNMGFQYWIEDDGFVKLPILGKIYLAGYTVKEAEKMLEELFSKDYNDPYVLVRVTNRRVIVFPGENGRATVIEIANENLTLMEALALAGGLADRGKAHKIKVIRNAGPQQKVFLIDMSTIDGLRQANLVMQANDIVYVEPRIRVVADVVREITPLVTLLSSLLIIYTTYRILTPQ
jgi:polysaccharide export outer membrane protein